METEELIFISFSKQITNEVGKVFKTLIDRLYVNKNVKAFLSSQGIKAGDNFKLEISKNLKKAKCGISILTPENKEFSPWLMFEAGALSVKVEDNGGKFLPYLFCREMFELDSPITDRHTLQYQPDGNDNLMMLIDYFIEINNTLSENNKIKSNEIKNFITKEWGESLEEELENLASRMNDFSLSGQGSKKSRSGNNDSLSLHSAKTIFQNNIKLLDDFTPITPLDIENQFEKILKSQISKDWIATQDADEIKFDIHRVMVNETRFSTFVSFTDGKRIILFDRAKDKPNTNVYNERFDVFGSVQFENRTIKNKIKNKAFLNSPIIKIEEITGVAVESNRSKKDHTKKETAVMLGLCIYMKKEDLDLATKDSNNNEIGIYYLNKMFDIKKETLTSKASLSISHSLGKI